MSNKRSSPEFKGPGYLQRYAKRLQAQFRLSWTAALARAKAEVLTP